MKFLLYSVGGKCTKIPCEQNNQHFYQNLFYRHVRRQFFNPPTIHKFCLILEECQEIVVQPPHHTQILYCITHAVIIFLLKIEKDKNMITNTTRSNFILYTILKSEISDGINNPIFIFQICDIFCLYFKCTKMFIEK